MLALSWKQPYASLMLHGKIETRTWNTNYRGLVLICASKTLYTDEQLERISGKHVNRIMNTLHPINIEKTMGHAIAVGKLVDCRLMEPKDEDKCFVKYYDDIWCHVYESVKPIYPIPFKGSQKWKRLDQQFINSIRYK